MATRLYVGATTAATLTPAFGTLWNVSTNAIRRRLAPDRAGDTMTSKAHAVSGSSGDEHLWFQFIGEFNPLAAQTIASGTTVTINFRIQESDALANVFLFANVRIMSSDGATQRGAASGVDATEAATTLISREMSVSFSGDVTVTAGDIIVVEIGFTKNSTTSYTITLSSGDNTTTDLVGDGDSGADRPWIEFSQDLTFQTTRFYFPSETGGNPISPAVGAGWTQTSSTFGRYALRRTKSNSAFATLTSDAIGGSGHRKVFAQFVSPPLTAQTIDPRSIAMVLKVSAAAASVIFWRVEIRVIAPDGSTVRGTLCSNAALDVDEEAWTLTTLTSEFGVRRDADITSVTATAGDYLVVEIGGINVDSVGRTGSIRLGDSSATDLDTDDGETVDNNGWIEFRSALEFIDTSNLLMLLGVGT